MTPQPHYDGQAWHYPEPDATLPPPNTDIRLVAWPNRWEINPATFLTTATAIAHQRAVRLTTPTTGIKEWLATARRQFFDRDYRGWQLD